MPAAATALASAAATDAPSSCASPWMSWPTRIANATTTIVLTTAIATAACPNWAKRSPRPMTMIPASAPMNV